MRKRYRSRLSCIRKAHCKDGKCLDTATQAGLRGPQFKPCKAEGHLKVRETAQGRLVKYGLALAQHRNWGAAPMRLHVPTSAAAVALGLALTGLLFRQRHRFRDRGHWKEERFDHGETGHKDRRLWDADADDRSGRLSRKPLATLSLYADGRNEPHAKVDAYWVPDPSPELTAGLSTTSCLRYPQRASQSRLDSL